MNCDRCGHTLLVGDYPFCKGRPLDHAPQATAIATDESYIGGVTIENMGHEPVTVYSRQEFQRAMQARGLEQRIKYVPGDKHLTNCNNYIDAYTLANAKALLERVGQGHTATDPAALQTAKFSVTMVKSK